MFKIKEISYQYGNTVAKISTSHEDCSAIIYNNNIDEQGWSGFLVMNADGFRKMVVTNPIEVVYDESVYNDN